MSELIPVCFVVKVTPFSSAVPADCIFCDAPPLPDDDAASEGPSPPVASSFVQELFQAQYRSSLTCPHCQKQSNTFDPFLCISLPIPLPHTSIVSQCGRIKLERERFHAPLSLNYSNLQSCWSNHAGSVPTGYLLPSVRDTPVLAFALVPVILHPVGWNSSRDAAARDVFIVRSRCRWNANGSERGLPERSAVVTLYSFMRCMFGMLAVKQARPPMVSLVPQPLSAPKQGCTGSAMLPQSCTCIAWPGPICILAEVAQQPHPLRETLLSTLALEQTPQHCTRP
ncbi:hypothetical protein JZ751_026212 [Albula glossodonta]|uniref:Uncharacterized protein n=1 Tax=Albula glossodonta TaxID=121402 RepID=A0A8T2PCB0_9TELE|nr:hypothetical protein JZ751_026212 [Albula glossodonta]